MSSFKGGCICLESLLEREERAFGGATEDGEMERLPAAGSLIDGEAVDRRPPEKNSVNLK